jgi:hypothetical protein
MMYDAFIEHCMLQYTVAHAVQAVDFPLSPEH